MRVVSVLLLGVLLLSPLWLLNTLVMPELERLQYTYSNLDEIATRVAEE